MIRRTVLAGLLSSSLAGTVRGRPLPKMLRFVLFTPFVDYEVFDPVRKGSADAAAALGVHIRFDGVKDGDVAALAAKAHQALNEGYDGIGLNIVDTIAFDMVAEEAAARGVPLIGFNVDDAHTPNARLAAVGQNMLAAGKTFGREAATFVPRGAHVLVTMHDPGISALEERAKGIQEILAPQGVRWTTLVTSTDQNVAIARIQKALLGDSSMRIIFGTGSADTEAAGLVIERHFPRRGYKAAGFDTSPGILRLVKAGILRFTIDQHLYAQGYYSVVALMLRVRYGILPANVDTGAAIIRAGDVDNVLRLAKGKYR